MFEGAFYYDFGNGVQVLETEAMRFKLAKWRKKRKIRSESIAFTDYVADVFATLSLDQSKSTDINLTEGYARLSQVERMNMALEKAHPELNRRKILL